MFDSGSVLACLLNVFWVWRICAFFYSSYSISDVLTPTCGGWVKASVMFCVMATSVIFQLIPLTEFPRVSLANRIISIPFQAYSLYFAHRYIGRTLDSRRVTIFLYIITILSILETLYMINLDWNKIE